MITIKENKLITDYEGLRKLGEHPKVDIVLTNLTCGHYVYPVLKGYHCSDTECPLCGKEYKMDWPENSHYHGRMFDIIQISNNTTKSSVGDKIYFEGKYISRQKLGFWKEGEVLENLRQELGLDELKSKIRVKNLYNRTKQYAAIVSVKMETKQAYVRYINLWEEGKDDEIPGSTRVTLLSNVSDWTEKEGYKLQMY